MADLIIREGIETRLDTPTGQQSLNPQVIGLKLGGWISAWTQPGVGGHDLYYQRYDDSGNPVGDKIRVNIPSGETHLLVKPTITATDDGGWIFVWGDVIPDATPGVGDESVIYQRRYTKDGDPTGEPSHISTPTTGPQETLSITTLSDGSYVVTWSAGASFGPTYDIRQRHFSADGNPLGDEITVNTTMAEQQWRPQVSSLKDGGWVVVWQSAGQDGDGAGVYMQRYNSNGEPEHKDASGNPADQLVNITTAKGQGIPDVEVLADGSYVVIWQSEGQDGDGQGVYMRRFTSDGVPTTGEIRVNTTTKGYQGDARIVALSDGSWVVTWTGQYQKDSETLYGVFQQTYASNGRALGSETMVNTLTSGHAQRSSVTLLDDGSWVVSYTIVESATSLGVYQQRFRLGEIPDDIFNEAPSDVRIQGESVVEGAATGTVVGLLQGSDPNLAEGDVLTYELRDNAGGRFVLDGATLKVANGALLDYESATSHTIVVRVTDKHGESLDRTLTVHVSDALDIFRGGKGKDVLTGTAGADRFYGALGNDIMTGKTGQDVFVFNTKPHKKTNRDTITDFSVADDTIWLDNAVFKKLGKKGSEDAPAALNKKFFKIADKAKSKTDYLIYDKKKGILYYDEDGSGSKAAVEIAKLPKKLKLTAADFFVV
ncbi:cadherin domain-containing protein [Microvirga flavescens]|uniref:cadherin domain-containing protein n=1 Tax=Microvirga flavescens TaxID=2249811 RepID=UPI000DD6E700|nr:cadherin domain-containing protein [Microvirga flavescens]